MPLLQLEPFTNVGANQRAVLRSFAVLGTTVKKLYIDLGGTFTKAMMTLIRIKLNQKTVIEASGTQIDLINQYLGIDADAGYLTIHLDDITALLPGANGEDVGAWNLPANGVNSFQVEIDIGAATNPTLDAWAEVVSPRARNEAEAQVAPAMRSLIRSTLTPGAAAQHTYNNNDVNMGPAGSQLARLFIFHTGNVTNLEVKKSNNVIYENVPVALAEFIQEEHNRVPQSNLLVFDPQANGDVRNGVINDAFFQWLITTSGSDTLTVLSDLRTNLAAL